MNKTISKIFPNSAGQKDGRDMLSIRLLQKMVCAMANLMLQQYSIGSHFILLSIQVTLQA